MPYLDKYCSDAAEKLKGRLIKTLVEKNQLKITKLRGKLKY